MKVPSDPDPGEIGLAAAEQSPASEFFSEISKAPCTALLLAINLGVAYYLWSRRVGQIREGM